MTTPAHSPEPNEAPPVKMRRGMVAFYVFTGLVVALLLVGYLACTPLRVRYWEGRARKPIPAVEAKGSASSILKSRIKQKIALGARREAIYELTLLGSPARSALQRLLTSEDAALREAVRHHLEGMPVRGLGETEQVFSARKELIDWWESEGRAKYGRTAD